MERARSASERLFQKEDLTRIVTILFEIPSVFIFDEAEYLFFLFFSYIICCSVFF